MVMALLKQHTEDLHRRVEAAVDIPGRTETLGAYGELLARLYGFHEPFEDWIGRMTALDRLGLDLPARRKTPLLAADLSHLGRSARDLAAIPRCPSLPKPLDVAEALGCLYVVEGATLGGQIIRRRIERSLGLTDFGCAFYSSYGPDVGRMWKAFREVAEAAVVTAEQRQGAQEFAAATFEAFEAWVGPRSDDRWEHRRKVGA